MTSSASHSKINHAPLTEQQAPSRLWLHILILFFSKKSYNKIKTRRMAK